ncbi:MAG: uridine kinase [Bacilli bacterium]|nr:uridine kinase [Bacilli bacterium]
MAKIIGIAGGTASGKTTIAKRLKQLAEPHGKVAMLRLDDYYKDMKHLTLEQRRQINFDHPDSYDIDLLIKHINDLQNNIQIQKPVYDFVYSIRSDETELVDPSDLIIVEGILAFCFPELLELFDMKIFVDTPDDIRFIRRLKRDMEKRGRTIESVVNQYFTTVRPMHHTFVEPSKRNADIIVPEGGKNEVAIDILSTKLRSLLKQKKN